MGKRTALYDTHRNLGARMVDFGGWDMPLHYGSQLEEHHCVRRHCGMFDVSHMTIIDVDGPDATQYLRRLLANDVARLGTGQAQYSAMLNEQGGVIDDLIVYNLQIDRYRLVVNCATRQRVLAWMTQQARGHNLQLHEQPGLAIIAVQGPQAIAAVRSVVCAETRRVIAGLASFECCDMGGQFGDEFGDQFIARTGYTGEDGLEIIVPEAQAPGLWSQLSAAGVAPVGLAARDTLRLEAGMNLYGNEMDETVSPLIANMGWMIAWGGDHQFIGREALQVQVRDGVSSKLVGVALRERAVLRAHQSVKITESARDGEITSGTFSPTLGYSIALARVPLETGREALVEVRGKWLPVVVGKPVFVRKGVTVFE